MSARPESSVARLEVTDQVAEIIVNAPPVNALGKSVRESLLTMIQWVDEQPDIEAAVIRCDGTTFFAGADIREFGKPPLDPSLPEVVNRIEMCRKPVVAAIHGNALGGGLEVALACHYRLALATAKLGFPEVKLGLLPGAGGTQRLPRLVGTEAALELMTSGIPISAGEAQTMSIVDRTVNEDLPDAARAFARQVAGASHHPRRTCDAEETLAAARADMTVFDRFLTKNARRFRGLDAPPAIVSATQAALTLPFKEGLAFERRLFQQLLDGPQAPALRHVFFAEREATKVPGLSRDINPRPIQSVGIVGAGTMGSGIALAFLLANFPVILVDTSNEALNRGIEHIHKTLDQNIANKRLDPQKGAQARRLLSPSLKFDDLSDVDLVVEAAYETIEVKREVFTRIDAIVKQGAILATNTSYLDVDDIAAVTRRPGDVLGLHFFSPANVMKLVEIVRGAKTGDDALVTALSLAKRIGKVAVVAGVAYGFIGNRMLHVRRKFAEALILGGIDLYRIDTILERFGMPMGPFRMYDLAGLDLGWSPATSRGATIQERLCEMGRRGQKTGAGYYDYDEARRPRPSEIVRSLIRDFVMEKGTRPLELSDEEILERLLYPMINEGYRILDEGKAFRGSDIDIVWINGYGWPAYTGGPMYYAERVGPRRLVDALTGMGDDRFIADGLRQAAASPRSPAG